jgi:hypothetical protein
MSWRGHFVKHISSPICTGVVSLCGGRKEFCSFLMKESADWYSCNAYGFKQIAPIAAGKVRRVGKVVQYDYNLISHEKGTRVNICIYRLLGGARICIMAAPRVIKWLGKIWQGVRKVQGS